jgi:capsular exopolysaccharide synthesis family protein
VADQNKLALDLEDCDENAAGAKRHLLALSQGAIAGRVIAVTSARGGEGVSTISRRLALSLTHRLGDTLLVDAHLCRASNEPTEGRVAAPAPGLAEAIAETSAIESLIALDEKKRMHLLPAGYCAGHSMLLVASSNFDRLMLLLRRRYKWIVIDAPPIALVQDAAAISRAADGTIIVVRAEYTRAEVIAEAQRVITRAGGKILGAVLNRRRYHIPNWIYRTLYGQASMVVF